jgi:hypothetical protein
MYLKKKVIELEIPEIIFRKEDYKHINQLAYHIQYDENDPCFKLTSYYEFIDLYKHINELHNNDEFIHNLKGYLKEAIDICEKINDLDIVNGEYTCM